MWETVVLLTLISGVRPDSNSNAVVSIDETNLKHLLTGHQLVFMTFGANWCPYSINLEPIFEEAAKEFEEHYSTSDVIWASVECTAQQRICERYGINKYPTIKLFCFGDPVDEEYRGDRSVEGLTAFVTQYFKGALLMFSSENQLEQLRNKQRRSIIAYLTRDGAAYETLYRIALSLHEFCDFWAPSEELSLKLKTYELGRVIFKSPNAVALIQFDDRIENFGNLRDWIVSNCIPDVRELTFKNAEGFTEERLPFLVYLRDAQNKTGDNLFIDAVVRELKGTQPKALPLFADANLFSYVVRHLGRNTKDLPILFADDFEHILVFPEISDLQVDGRLRQFVDDLHSGSLKERYLKEQEELEKQQQQAHPSGRTTTDTQRMITESAFKKLRPSRRRYSLVKTEL
ncbi:hypothetical protein Q1695_005229 [Nippostrongylus brasiliensis]|nr:hypothetical protein Q1695_005229 [Nippostrongylus brasiliensis]